MGVLCRSSFLFIQHLKNQLFYTGYANSEAGLMFCTFSEVSDLDKAWKKLTNALAGQFCASLNFLDSTQSINPKWSFNPTGILSKSNEKLNVKFGMLPGENVCTENLTPWKKLLPCGTKRGLATMLNADHIHSSKYHSLGLSLRKICPKHQNECSDPDLELSLYVVLVFDPAGNILYVHTHGVIFLHIAAIVYCINTLDGLGSQMWVGQGQAM